MRQANSYRAARKGLAKEFRLEWRLLPFQGFFDPVNVNRKPDPDDKKSKPKRGFAVKMTVVF